MLKRYKNQVIYVGDDIRVIIDDIRGNRVRIRIIAPPSVNVFREEIYKHAVAALSIGARKEVTAGLVLTRKTNEAIRIGDDIRLVVVDVSRDSVRIGTVAPRSVAVDREEVRLKKRAGNNPAKKAA